MSIINYSFTIPYFNYFISAIWSINFFSNINYTIYTYSEVKLENNRYFNGITKSDISTIYEHIDHFESVIKGIGSQDSNDDLFVNYSFDRSIIDTNDYYFLDIPDNYPKFGRYSLYILDVQTLKLYYIHHNI